MSYFAVIRNAGPTWIDGSGAFEQPGAGEHATYMNADDPWARAERLVTSSIEPWNLFVGAERLSATK